MKKTIVSALSCLFLLLATANSRALQPSCCLASTLGGLYLGFGLNQTSVRSDALEGEASGAGLNFIVGGRVYERLSFEVTVDALLDHPATKPTTDIYYPADTAEYSVLRYGVKFDFLDLAKETWTPWISVGEAMAFLLWDTYWYNQSGTAFYISLGVDKEFSPGWIFRARFSPLSVKSEDNYGYGGHSISDTTFAFTLVYEFGRSALQ